MMAQTWGLYALAALLEIGGCFAVWLWSRHDQPIWLAALGVVALIGFAALLTRVPMDAAGRAFAAYGGIYIVASLAWLVVIEKQMPTRWDMGGGILCLAGATTILWGARG